MVMDYREKKLGRGEAERRPVQKNRPRKEPAGMFALLAVAALVVVFGAGVGTGWFARGMRKPPAAAVAAQPARKDEPAQAAAPKQPAPDAQLTFYKTLPAGSKAALGSGMNLKKPEQTAAHPAPAAAPQAAPAPAAAGEAKEPQEQKEPKEEAKVQKEGPAARFVVQVASYHDRKEADAAQARLAGKGVAAYVVESKVADKGVWYRIRVGRHLSRAEADALAGKSGKGSLVLPE